MKKANGKKTGNSGLVTAFVLVVLFVLSVLGFAFGSRGSTALSQAYVSRQYMQAFYAAQAGIMTAIEAEQQGDPNVPTTCGAIVSSDPPPPPGATNLASLQTLSLPYTLPDNAKFSITITNNTNTTQCTSPAPAPDGTSVPTGSVYITSKGTAQGKTRVANVMVPVTFGSPPVDFNYGLFSQKTITMTTGALIDSYESGNGAYGGSNVGNEGNIGSNSGANSTITLTTGATVKGEVDVGPGGTEGPPSIIANSGAKYTKGDVLSTQASFPTVTIPNPPGVPSATNFTCSSGNCILSPGAYNNITVSNDATMTVGCGNYSMNSIAVSTGAILTINNCSGANPVKFYVDGSGTSTPMNFSTGTISNLQGGVQVPAAFQIYDLKTCASPPCGTDTLSTGSGSAFTLYAPNDTINLSTGGNIYGSLIGYTINDSTGALLHYDESLEDIPIGQGTTPTVVGNFTIWNFQ